MLSGVAVFFFAVPDVLLALAAGFFEAVFFSAVVSASAFTALPVAVEGFFEAVFFSAVFSVSAFTALPAVPADFFTAVFAVVFFSASVDREAVFDFKLSFSLITYSLFD